jgi:predicted XRE-type DNA-binding protein
MKNKYVDVALDPAYWVEHINNDMYNALITYMEDNKLNQTHFAAFLGISKGRLSQILNSGETNFTIEKLVSIALKINKIPKIELQDKEQFIKEANSNYQRKMNITYGQHLGSLSTYKAKAKDNIIKLPTKSSFTVYSKELR